MEGSSGTQRAARSDPKIIFGNAGLPEKLAAAWLKSELRFGRNFKSDTAAAGKYWRSGADLLAKLPKKPNRTVEQQAAADTILSRCRDARERFLTRHVDTVYRKLTKNLTAFRRVDEIVNDAAKLVPGLTPTRQQVDAESALMQSEKDGVEVDQGIFLAQVLALPDSGAHLCQAMLLPKPEAIERTGEFIKSGVVDFGPARVERRGKSAVVTVKNPRFLNAEDDDTLDDTETAADIAILDPMSEICVLRGDVVDHPKYAGRKISTAAGFPTSGTSAATWAWSTRCCAGWPRATSAPMRRTAGRGRNPGSPASMSSPSAAAASICW
jgi:thioesterase DpgC